MSVRRNVEKGFRRGLERAGLPHFRLYDLRHTFASQLLAEGTPITYVSAQLGHARPTTTLQWYARWLPVEDKRLVDSLDGPSEEASGSQMVANDNGAAEAAPQLVAISGAPRWNRTTNLLIKSQLLCQLS
jgi:integrase-like protein